VDPAIESRVRRPVWQGLRRGVGEGEGEGTRGNQALTSVGDAGGGA
jgi:hypothetical protein